MRRQWAIVLAGAAAFLASCSGGTPLAFDGFAIESGSFRTTDVLRLSRDATSALVLIGEDEDAGPRFAVHALDQGVWRSVHEAGLPPGTLFVDTLALGDADQLVVFDGRRLFRLGPTQWQPEPLGIGVLPTIYRGEASGLACVDVARDVNGDGRDDIVLADFDGLWIVRQDGTGGFAEPVKIPVAPTMDSSLSVSYAVPPVYAADYDGDGRGDLGVLHGSRLRVFKDATVATTDVAVPGGLTVGDGSGEPVRVLNDVGDYNGDGVVDLSIGTEEAQDDLLAATSTTSFYFGERRDGLVVFPNEPGGNLQTGAFGDVEMTDVNGDGLVDAVAFAGELSVRKLIAALVTRSMSVHIHIYIMGAAGFAAEPDVTRKIKVSQNRNPFGFGDVNGDGLADFVQQTDEGLAIYLGERNEARLAKRAVAVALRLPFAGRSPSEVEAVDFDGDGRDDFLLRYANQEDGVGVVMSR